MDNKHKIQTLISYDSGRTWKNLSVNSTNKRLNLHMFSSYIQYEIFQLQTSQLGGIIANGSEGNYLLFPEINENTNQFDYESKFLNTYYSNNLGLNFNKVKINLKLSKKLV